MLRVRLHRHWHSTSRPDPDTRPAHRSGNQGLSCSSAQVPAFSSSRWSLTRSSPRQGPRLHGGSPSLGLSGFSLTRRVWYSLSYLSPLLCVLTYLRLGGVFDDSLIHSHITSHLHSSSEDGCQVLSKVIYSCCEVTQT
jgi:hypothetical protein